MQNNRRPIKKYIVWIPAVLIAVAIFCFSAQPAEQSSELSDRVTLLLLAIAERLHLLELSPEKVYDLCVMLSTPVRKSAHITEFTALYISVLFALRSWDFKGNRWIGTAFAATVLYACTDEIHQIFVPGRAGMITDVMIDSLGAAVLTLILNRMIAARRRT